MFGSVGFDRVHSRPVVFFVGLLFCLFSRKIKVLFLSWCWISIQLLNVLCILCSVTWYRIPSVVCHVHCMVLTDLVYNRFGLALFPMKGDAIQEANVTIQSLFSMSSCMFYALKIMI